MIVSPWWIYLQRFPKKWAFLVLYVLIPERVIILASFIRKHPSLGVMLWDDWTRNFRLLSLWLFTVFEYFILACLLVVQKFQRKKIFFHWTHMNKWICFWKKELHPLNFTFHLSCEWEKLYRTSFFFIEKFYHSNVHTLIWGCEGVLKIL